MDRQRPSLLILFREYRPSIGPDALSPGKHTLEFDFRYDGLGPATLAFNNLSVIGHGGVGVLKLDGEDVARQTMERTLPIILQWDENGLQLPARSGNAPGRR